MGASDTSILGRSENEARRLIFQNQLYGPLTRRFFTAAGIGTGMKVLDLGSGAGDVALLAADLVGPTGRVVGVDIDPKILEIARARTASAGWCNVTFLAGDPLELILDADFDAVVGRWILHIPNHVEILRHLVTRLKVGGIVAFHENDFTDLPTAFLPSELARRIRPHEIPGPEAHMGTRLLKIYLAAGLTAPQFLIEAPAGGGPDWPGYEYVVETFRSLLPMLPGVNRVDLAEMHIDTLASRIRDDVVSRQGILMLPIMFGAWTRKPSPG